MSLIANMNIWATESALFKHQAKNGKMQTIYVSCLILSLIPGLNVIGALGLFLYGGEIGQHLLKTGYYYGMLDSKNGSDSKWSEIQKS